MKQPYIPLYVGDYIKDTRKLTLELRGFWMDLIVFAWDVKGILILDVEDLTRMIGVDKGMVIQSLKSLGEKDVCDVEFQGTDKVKITVRWIVRHLAKSSKMTEIGKLGGNPNLKKDKGAVNQPSTTTDYPAFDNDNITDTDTKDTTKKKATPKEKKAEIIKKLVSPFDSPEFHQAWDTWLLFRKQINKPYRSELSAQAALRFLSNYPEKDAIKMIATSIQNEWQGLFELKNNGTKTTITEDRANTIISDFKAVADRRGTQGK